MKRSLRYTLLAAATVAAFGVSGLALAQDSQLKTEKDKVSYMVGMQIGSSLSQIKDEIDMAMVTKAIESTLKGETPLLTQEQAMEVQKGFAERLQAKRAGEMQVVATKNKAEGEAFLTKNKAVAGVKTTTTGLQYQIVKAGTGPKPSATDTVKVHYTGTTLDGTKFDSSVDRGEPAQFALNAVIPGWTEALALMPVGSKWTLWIPSGLAYGDRGRPGIPGKATLVFDVELIEVVSD